MSERELLTQLVENSRKQLFYARVRTLVTLALGVVIAAGIIVAAPKALKMVSQANEIMAEASGIIAHADAAIESITAMSDSVAQMGESMNDLITENSQTVAEIMEKVESVDFEGLNIAIKNLGDVVAPIAKFFNLF